MGQKAPIVIIALIAALAGYVFYVASKVSPSGDAGTLSAQREQIAGMQDRIRELEAGQQKMVTSIDDLARALREQGRVVRAVEAGASTAVASDPAAVEAERAAARAAAATEKLTVESALALLLKPGMDWDDRQALWKRLREAGLFDAVLAEYEKVASKSKDANAQTELGQAYLEKIQQVTDGPEKGTWASKADAAFDRALEIDPEHWDARFAKAMALSFWPPVFGKQTEAIKHFEMLVSQQEKHTSQAGYDNTYLMLGNLYQQMGQTDKAVATWKKGLVHFPQSTALSQQIANAPK